MDTHVRDRRIGRLPLVLVALTGVVVGHWLTYLLAVPQAHLRDAILASSGHGYWFVAAKLAAVFAVTGVGVAVLERFGSAVAGVRSRHLSLRALAAGLLVVQLVGFTAMELFERIAAGAPLSTLFVHHVFLLGLAVQSALAFLSAGVLSWLGRTAARAATALAVAPVTPARRAVALILPPVSRPVPFPAGTPVVIRGPPSIPAVVAAR